MTGASDSETVFTKVRRIAELARQSPGMAFTSLAHLIDVPWLLEAYRRTRKDGAPGIDRQTAADYEADLVKNLGSLRERAISGTYRAPPVRRVHIPKGDGSETRPIGIPTFEDKILQRAVVMVLEAIYEQDFHSGSFGFRPGRSAHQALDRFRQQAMAMRGCWVVEVDIQRFFDTLDHTHLRDFLRLRLRDGVLLRLIGKWLRAGVMEDGHLTVPDSGSPQGGVISPLLSNVVLHLVLDMWFEREVRSRLRGDAFLIRFADDFIMGFAHESDARRVLEVLPKRFARYGLTLHPEKTRLVPFMRPPTNPSGGTGSTGPSPGSFDFLGFTHYWARSRQGYWVVKCQTAKSRFSRTVKRIAAWCRVNRHRPIAEQQHTLGQKLRGHYAYFGRPGNGEALQRLRYEVTRVWRKWLIRRRRGRTGSWGSWDWFNDVLRRFPLPLPRIRAPAVAGP